MAEPVPLSNITNLPPPPEALPPTKNPHLLAEGSLSLYNPILFLASAAVLQHFIIFGVAALLRGFSPKRTLDLHYLTFFFALSLAAAPAVFLLDLKIDQLKLLFFLEHEAIEYLIFVRVLAPPQFVKRWSGMIMFVAWTALFCVTTVIVLDHFHHKAAMIAAWGAFTSDFAVGVAGAVLVMRWVVSTPNSRFGARRLRAEGLAGVGFMTHGFMTMCVPPIFTCVLYDKMHPDWFAYAWVVVWISAYFAIAFCIPAVALFFSNINWCCGRKRKVFPGQVAWRDVGAMEDVGSTDGGSTDRTVGVTMTYKEPF